MFDLKHIQEYYPENLRAFKKNILREYLQYKILEIIFNSKFANQLSFIGGTALCIVYGNSRFSEDLDFDNFGLNKNDFLLLTRNIERNLRKQGYEAEIRNVFKGAYRCYIKLPKILFDNDLSGLEEEKITIQVDTAPHKIKYQIDKKILNKFDVFTQINITPLDILLSQKIYAIFNRKRLKGRDFFDTIFLLQKTKPNYEYLKVKLGIQNNVELKNRLIKYISDIDFDKLAKDVEPFLFVPSDSKKIKMFGDYIRQKM